MNTSIAMPGQPGPNPDNHIWWHRFVRRKGHIGPMGLSLLMVFACAPLVMVLARLLAFPGMLSPDLIGFDALRQFGSFLNQSFTLEWMPLANRRTILYILMLPTALLLITFAQLTFGLRVLGLRAILISVAFLQIGIIPSLMLIMIVVAIIFLLRSTMDRLRLPLFARISVISCIAAIIMVAALFIGPWMRSETIWSVAFFPVIILAMLAEGIGKTFAQDNALIAIWRLGWTLVLALLIACVSYPPAIRDFALHFPELMLTQLILIIFISEFLDFRLLHNFQAGLGKPTSGIQTKLSGRTRVAVVRNRWNTGVISQLGMTTSTKTRYQSVQRIVDTLRDMGFTVKVFEGDTSLLRKLKEFLPPNPQTLEPGGMVLNLATGIQGNGRFSHLPSMLEMSGVAYTGPDPIAHIRILDRYVLMMLLKQSGVPTPRFKLMSNEFNDMGDLQFPLVVRPRCEPDTALTIVSNHQQLGAAVQLVVNQYRQEAMVETFFNSPEIRVSLLGNKTIECLPLLLVDSAGNGKICPAPIDDALADQIRECAKHAYAVAGCRDYARVDFRLTQGGEACVVQIHSLGILSRKGSFIRSAEVGGYSFQSLLYRIMEIAWDRYDTEIGTSMNLDNIGTWLTSRLSTMKALVK
jgi:D-alanine-D-alanine ligase